MVFLGKLGTRVTDAKTCMEASDIRAEQSFEEGNQEMGSVIKNPAKRSVKEGWQRGRKPRKEVKEDDGKGCI